MGWSCDAYVDGIPKEILVNEIDHRKPYRGDHGLRFASRLLAHDQKKTKPIRPNAGIEADYRRKLTRLIDEMQRSVNHWLSAAYRQNEPNTAFDASPVAELQAALKALTSRWQSRFDEMALKLADWFATSASSRSDAVLRKILRDGGFSVKFKMTAVARDVMNATIAEQVGLIKSIPQKYLSEVQGAVMRSVQTGRDLKQLTDDLQRIGGVTRRRAAFIARGQNNKATASMTRARFREVGIRQAVWMHSHAGKEPRPTHVRMNGKRYDVEKGMWDSAEGRYVLPGELINCRCTPRPVLPGFG